MDAIETEVSDMRTALTQVHTIMGSKTWVGAGADKWAADFDGRLGALNWLFGRFPEEEKRLVAKAHAKQTAEDRKRTGWGA